MEFDGYGPDDPRKQQKNALESRDLLGDVLATAESDTAEAAAPTASPEEVIPEGSDLEQIKAMVKKLVDALATTQAASPERDKVFTKAVAAASAEIMKTELATLRAEVVATVHQKAAEVPASQLRYVREVVTDLIARHSSGSRLAMEKVERDIAALVQSLADERAERRRIQRYWVIGLAYSATLLCGAYLLRLFLM
jgi:hypothetical protein